MSTMAVTPPPAVAPARVRSNSRSASLIYTAHRHPSSINLLPQVRKSYSSETIAQLADSIAAIGMIQLPLVAELTTKDKAAEYLEYFNRGLGSSTTVADLVPDIKTGHFFVVIFGHRRTKAHVLLFSERCSDCSAQKRRRHACATRHVNLNPEGMETRVIVDPDPQHAMRMQLTENTSEQLSVADETDALRRHWEIEKRLDPKLTMTAFAKMNNKSLSYVRSALAFCELPQQVKRAANDKIISFSVAVELSRLQAHGFSEADVLRQFVYVTSTQKRHAEVRAYITAVIKDRVAPEDISIFGDDDPESYGSDSQARQAVHVRAIRAAAADLKALQLTGRAIEAGILPQATPGRNSDVRRVLANGDKLREELRTGKRAKAIVK